MNQYVVKRHGELVTIGDREHCEKSAKAMNESWQTDEYIVEPWKDGQYV